MKPSILIFLLAAISLHSQAQSGCKYEGQRELHGIEISWPKNWQFQEHQSGFSITTVSKGKEPKVLANVLLQIIDVSGLEGGIEQAAKDFSRKFYLEEMTGLHYEIVSQEEVTAQFSENQWTGRQSQVLERIFDSQLEEVVYGTTWNSKNLLLVVNYLQKEKKLKKSVECILASIALR